MTVAPRPQLDEPGPDPSGDAEGWALLDGLRRRLEDQSAVGRKTSSQVTQLAESIAALVAAQRKRSRWLNLNSFVAYVMFTMLCGGAFYYVYQSRVHELAANRDRATIERDQAVRRADEATAKAAARDAADAKALDAWQLIEAGKRDEAAKRLAELQGAPLSRFEREVLAARAKQAEVMQADAALKTAGAAFKAGRYAELVAPLEQALAIDGNGPRAAQMHYLAGVALAKTGELDKAANHLQAAVAGDVGDEDARFQLASVLDRAGQWGKARGEYDRFATAHPQSPFAVFAMRRSGTLARMPAVAPAQAQPPPQSPPAPPQAQPAKPVTPPGPQLQLPLPSQRPPLLQPPPAKPQPQPVTPEPASADPADHG